MDEADGSEGWDGVLEHLQQRREVSRAMGGEERLQKHRAAGKLDVRARIDHLVDPGSFQELGTLVGGEEAPADAIVIGSGRIDGRPVMVGAEDFTVKAGTISSSANAKRYRVAEIALRRPGAAGDDARGRRLPSRREAPTHGPRPTCSRRPAARARSRWSPRCSGASAGHGALVAPISDFSVMSTPRVGVHRRAARRVRVAR